MVVDIFNSTVMNITVGDIVGQVDINMTTGQGTITFPAPVVLHVVPQGIDMLIGVVIFGFLMSWVLYTYLKKREYRRWVS